MYSCMQGRKELQKNLSGLWESNDCLSAVIHCIEGSEVLQL